MNGEKLLLHICCAPDATVPWPELIAEGWDVTGFLYGGNIHPREEYERRADALRTFAMSIGENASISSFDDSKWLTATKEFAQEPEGGARCALCFSLQLEVAAQYAIDKGIAYLSTTLTISPHKNPEQINRIGSEAAEKFGLIWVEKIWRKNDGFKRSVVESKRLSIFRQNYCGCIYSISGEKNDG